MFKSRDRINSSCKPPEETERREEVWTALRWGATRGNLKKSNLAQDLLKGIRKSSFERINNPKTTPPKSTKNVCLPLQLSNYIDVCTFLNVMTCRVRFDVNCSVMGMLFRYVQLRWWLMMSPMSNVTIHIYRNMHKKDLRERSEDNFCSSTATDDRFFTLRWTIL